MLFSTTLILLILFIACGGQSDTTERDENLAKLGKVWGFVKYTHHSFISGQLDWDAELLNIIPIIYNSSAEDVNGILYDWFISLGEDGYDFEFGHDFVLSDFLTRFATQFEQFEALNDPSLEALTNNMRELHEFFASLLRDGYDLDLQSFAELTEEVFPEMLKEIPMEASSYQMRPMADLSWINEEYLGPLAVHLLRFNGVSTVNTVTAPVFAGRAGTPNFSNQSVHPGMNFRDTGYRLLGLFRLWNAMKYYFPHLDILGADWNSLLLEFIPLMLEGSNRRSYESTLALMAHHLHDAHVHFDGMTLFADMYGQFMAPVQLTAAEGRIVVYQTHGLNSPLARGDVILGLNGRNISDLMAEMKPFLPYPNDEKALVYLAQIGGSSVGGFHMLRSHTRRMRIDILRGDIEMRVNIRGVALEQYLMEFIPPAIRSHMILTDNIGLINPALGGDVHRILDEFAATDGIIIDLRQHPFVFTSHYDMRQYLMEEPLPFAYISAPSWTHPGMRVDEFVNQYAPRSPYAFIYERPVVLLMDIRTFSRPEWFVMSFRVAPNVTVIGSNSIGSNGDVAFLPLPCGINMMFTSIGIYTPEGGQTHRIGLSPDIRVDRTIQGIREGRDELMEAAIEYILGSMQ